jgi:TPP-dependent pyruvate/acetoin dehydrogenase alpha subunit
VDHAEAYRRCLTIRSFEDATKRLKSAGEIQGSLHLCVGQEAIPTGTCAALGPTDRIMCTYRGHGWMIARGIPLSDLFAELMGRDSTLCGGRGGSAYMSAIGFGMLGENSIVGGGMPIAAGSALRSQQMPDGAVTIAVIGDGALNQGAVHEALNFAAVLKLPLVTIVENNGYAELTPTNAMFPVTPLSARAAAYGMPAHEVDGNDVDAVADTMAKVTGAARGGDGPQFVEAHTHRLSGHYDLDPQTYRPEGELEQAELDEPLARLGRELDTDVTDQMRTAVESEISQAIEDARRVPYPDAEGFRRHLYA